MKIKNIVFLGRKPLAYEAIKYLLCEGYTIKYVILDSLRYCYGIPVETNDKTLYSLISKKSQKIANIDLVVSYLYWRRIKQPLIDLPRYGCINFHPAPLPDYKGRAGYNTAILDGRKKYGVSAHYITDERFDAGPIIKVTEFPIDENENAYTLEEKSQKQLFLLFKDTLEKLNLESKINTIKNKGGIYVSSDQLEKMKKVDLKTKKTNIINKKIRAFFFPPYSGAYIKIKDEKFTLVNQETLSFINKKLNNAKK